jgi:hypothetical protein
MQKIGNFLLPASIRKIKWKGLQIVKHNNKKESRLSACIFSTPKTKTLLGTTKSRVLLIGAKHIWENHPSTIFI